MPSFYRRLRHAARAARLAWGEHAAAASDLEPMELRREFARLHERLDAQPAPPPPVTPPPPITLPPQIARPYYYLGDQRALTMLSTGDPFFVNTRDRGITPWIVLGGVWETFVDDILCALARPGTVFVDVGANQGYYTVKLSRLLGPEGCCYSFEPNPELYAFLADNIDINGIGGRAHAYCLAAGEAPGHSRLHFSYTNMGGGHVDPTGATPAATEADGIEVEIARIDDIVPRDRVVDLIKIDVEGFEPLVLHGMKETLSRAPEAAIVLEVSMAQWRRFGDPGTILSEVQGSRSAYLIGHDGRLRPLAVEEMANRVSPDFVSYVLLLPGIAERERAVSRFLAPDPA